MEATATPLVNEWGWVVTAPSSSYPFLLLLSHREKGMEDGSHCHPSGQGVGLGDNFAPPPPIQGVGLGDNSAPLSLSCSCCVFEKR